MRAAGLLATAAIGIAGCGIVGGGPITASDCGFGNAPLSEQGWTTLGALGLGPDHGVPELRIYALITRDEIEPTTSPPGVDGSTLTLIGRGLCYTVTGESIQVSGFGPIRRRLYPPPP